MIVNIGPYRRSKLPVLNGSYPADISVKYPEGGSTSAAFKVTITEDGKPAEYTYQWYLDGTAVSGATGSTYSLTLSASGTHKVWCVVTSKAGSVKSREATLTVSQAFTKSWTGSEDMEFYYGNGAKQNATNVGAYNDYSTRYGQVLWFTTDAAGGTGFDFDWNPRSFSGNTKTIYCRISETGKDSSGKWPGCTNDSDDIHYTTTDKGYRFSDASFVFKPNTKYYIYINRSSYDFGVHYYASGSPAIYGTSSITIH